MSPFSPEGSAAIRLAIERFLQERLDTKPKPLPPDDPKRQMLKEQYAHERWIDDAASRAGQIQTVTHALKATHPDARGTSLYRPPSRLRQLPSVGSHCLPDDFVGDVVGNAAALDVCKFQFWSASGLQSVTARAGSSENQHRVNVLGSLHGMEIVPASRCRLFRPQGAGATGVQSAPAASRARIFACT